MSQRPKRVSVKSKYMFVVPPVIKVKNKNKKKAIILENTTNDTHEFSWRPAVDTSIASKADTLEDVDKDINDANDVSMKSNCSSSNTSKGCGEGTAVDDSHVSEAVNAIETSTGNGDDISGGVSSAGTSTRYSSDNSAALTTDEANSGEGMTGSNASGRYESTSNYTSNMVNTDSSAVQRDKKIEEVQEQDDDDECDDEDADEEDDEEEASFKSHREYTLYKELDGQENYDILMRKK